MPPEDSLMNARVRVEIWAFLAEFRHRVRVNADADAELLKESRHAIDDSRALLRRMAIAHPEP